MSKRVLSRPLKSGKHEYAKHGMRTMRTERKVAKLAIKKGIE
jgi:hypothetical protein